MLLLVKYKSGETRRVNLTLEFFKSQELSVMKRAQDFAFMHGTDPYQIFVYRGSETLAEFTYRSNAPEEKKSMPWMVVDETKIKKQLKKQFKNVPFKEKYILHG